MQRLVRNLLTRGQPSRCVVSSLSLPTGCSNILCKTWAGLQRVRHGSYWHFEGKVWVGLQIMSKARAVLTITLSDWTRLAFLDSFGVVSIFALSSGANLQYTLISKERGRALRFTFYVLGIA